MRSLDDSSTANLRLLADIAKSDAATRGLESIVARSPDLRHALTSEITSAWKVLLPLDARGRVLSIGHDMPAVTMGLARWVSDLVVCDRSFDELAVVSRALNASRLAGAIVVQIADQQLPFQSGSFDCVIINSVNEPWPELSELLTEAHRVLKASGHVLLRVENEARSLLERRKLAAFGLRILGEITGISGSTSLTRTWFGYARALRRAGFPPPKTFSGIPEPRRIRGLIRVGERSPVSSNATGFRGGLVRLLDRSRLTVKAYELLSAKRAPRATWVEGLAAHVSDRLGIAYTNSRFPGISVSGAVSPLLIIFLGKDVVVRLPLDERAEAQARANHDALTCLLEELGQSVEVRAPKPLLADEYDGVFFVAESFLQLDRIPDAEWIERAERAERAITFLIELNSATRHDTEQSPVSIWNMEVLGRFRLLRAWARNQLEHDLVDSMIRVAESVDPNVLPIAAIHGDFKPENTGVANTNEFAVIDWDRWSRASLSTHDLLHFLCARRKLRGARSWLDAFTGWLERKEPDPIEEACETRFCAALELEGSWRSAAAISYWAREVSSRVGWPADFDRDWIESHCFKLIPKLLKHI